MSKLDYGFITEQMTDAEIEAFDRAGACFINDDFSRAKSIVALEINKKLWNPVWNFMRTIYEFSNREDGTDAE